MTYQDAPFLLWSAKETGHLRQILVVVSICNLSSDCQEEALSSIIIFFYIHQKKQHVLIWNWIQKYKLQKIQLKKKKRKVLEYIVDR